MTPEEFEALSRKCQLAIDLSRRARDEGISRAAHRAGDAWVEAAIHDFVTYLERRGEATMEMWRWDWKDRKQPEPASSKVYGAVAHIAAKRGLIVKTGRYTQAQSERTRAHAIPWWKAI